MKKTLLTFSLLLLLLPNLSQASPAETRLRGKILLQVEENGEAWYVKPENGQRMYMKDGDAAYGMMRDLGLGITNVDLAKIPIGFEDRFECLDSDNDGLCDKLEDGIGTDKNNPDTDGDGYNDGIEVRGDYNPLGTGKLTYDSSLINRLKGKILLQVETNGEAWYINPDDNKRYYMPDGPSAYQIMRYLSLGISNSDLAKIDIENGDSDIVNVDDTNYDWEIYTDTQNRFSFSYPSYFGIASSEEADIGLEEIASVKFSDFSYGSQEDKIILGGLAVLREGFIFVDQQALGGLYDPFSQGIFDEEDLNIILENIPTLTAENFCDELSKASHIDLNKSPFSSLSQQLRDGIVGVDQMRNFDPKVISCSVSDDTVTFYKEGGQEFGPVNHIYGAIRFLESPFSSFQIIRIAEEPTQEILDDITSVVKSFK